MNAKTLVPNCGTCRSWRCKRLAQKDARLDSGQCVCQPAIAMHETHLTCRGECRDCVFHEFPEEPEASDV